MSHWRRKSHAIPFTALVDGGPERQCNSVKSTIPADNFWGVITNLVFISAYRLCAGGPKNNIINYPLSEDSITAAMFNRSLARCVVCTRVRCGALFWQEHTYILMSPFWLFSRSIARGPHENTTANHSLIVYPIVIRLERRTKRQVSAYNNLLSLLHAPILGTIWGFMSELVRDFVSRSLENYTSKSNLVCNHAFELHLQSHICIKIHLNIRASCSNISYQQYSL